MMTDELSDVADDMRDDEEAKDSYVGDVLQDWGFFDED